MNIMKNLRRSSFGLVFFFLALAHAGEAIHVELDWEEVSGASSYELEFQDGEGHVLTTVQSKTPVFKFKMRVGRYKVRSRASDTRSVFGSWSDLNDVVIQPKTPPLTAKSLTTPGVISPKTRTAEVRLQWAPAPGAEKFHIRIFSRDGKLVKEEIVITIEWKTELAAGEYMATVASVGEGGIESDPVPLPDKIQIRTVRLEKPDIILDEVADPTNPAKKVGHLPLQKGTPVLRWKPTPYSVVAADLEYRYFFGEEWIPVDHFRSNKVTEWLLEKAQKPGRYRVSAWAEAPGLDKSEAVSYEFVVKPGSYSTISPGIP